MMVFRSTLFAALLLVVLLPFGAVARTEVPQSKGQIQLSYAPLVKQVSPAVVNIFTKRVVKSKGYQSPFMNDPFFRRFFGDHMRFNQPRERVENSLGSGVIVGRDGYVVTNHHVIKDAEEITVALHDRREFEAKVIVSDEQTDLAVLKFDPKGERFPTVRFGDSEALEVGDLVLAIGNPFGVGQTVTSGIVSAKARTRVGVSDYQFFIQTDAAINPGNSGGALVNMAGELVGINTAIYSRSGGSVGIGFAIPVEMVRQVVDGAKNGGKIERPWLGADGQAVTAEVAQGLGLKRPAGVLINDIYPKGPADKAGLRVGDVVLSVDEKPVNDMRSLRFRLAARGKQGKAALRIWRDGREFTSRVSYEVPPETPPRDERVLEGRHPFNQVKVGNLSPAFAEELERNPMESGVIVLSLPRRSYAAKIGIRPGDIIAAIDDHSIESTQGLEAVLSSSEGPWKITIERNGELKSVTVRGQ